MNDGRECGMRDGHGGGHHSPEALQRRRESERERSYELKRRLDSRRHKERSATDPDYRQRRIERSREYRASTKGILNDRKHARKKQIARLGALLGIPDLTLEQAKELITEMT